MNSDAMTATRGRAKAPASTREPEHPAVIALGGISVLALPVIAWQSAKAAR